MGIEIAIQSSTESVAIAVTIPATVSEVAPGGAGPRKELNLPQALRQPGRQLSHRATDSVYCIAICSTNDWVRGDRDGRAKLSGWTNGSCEM